MAWAQFVQMGMGLASSVFDTFAEGADAKTQKRIGYATANANEERIRRESAYSLGEQRASAAQSGFDPSSGSLLALQTQSVANTELDALTERYKGQLNAWQQDERMNRAADKFQYMIDPLGGRIMGKLGKAGSLVSAGAALSYHGGRSIRSGG